MDYVAKQAKNNLYVAIQGSCRVKVEHLFGSVCLSFVNIPFTIDIFNDFKCLLIINPRKLKLWTQSILFPSIFISGSIIFFCGWWNNMHFDLGTFRDNLLTSNQIDILHNSLFIKLSFMPFFVNKVVSSAKRINWNNLLELWRSFTYIRKNNIPSIEPCGNFLMVWINISKVYILRSIF